MHGSAYLVLGALLLLGSVWRDAPKLRREGYDYAACRKRGFDRRFCTVTPIHGVPSPACTCEDGEQGTYIIKHGAWCSCTKHGRGDR